MIPAPSFYSQADRDIFKDFQFIPQERFRFGFTPPTFTGTENTADAGIPTVMPRETGGGGGSAYTGGITGLNTNFFDTTANRQDRLRSLNMPLEQKGTPGGDILMENLQGYVGEPDDYLGIEEYNAAREKALGMTGPEIISGAPGVYQAGAKPTLSRRISDAFYNLPFTPNKPQTADQIISEGYTGRAGSGGILGTMLGMVDQYGNLPRGDQAFIARNMGYTGPTVFGANDSGLSKDPFGLNVRSGFGNYAERVGEEFDKLGTTLGASGKVGSKYEGATFNPQTGEFELDDDSTLSAAQLAAINKRTNLLRQKYQFYKKQTAKRDADRKAAKEAEEKRQREEAQRIQDELAAAAAAKDKAAALAAIKKQGEADYNPNIHGRTDYGRDSGGAQSFDFGGGFGIGSDGGPVSNRTGRGRTGFMDGGRIYYMDGGLADLVDIYD